MFRLRTQSKTMLHAFAVMLLLFVAAAVMTSTMEAQTVNWFLVSAGSPSARCAMGMAYDEATNSTVLFGGTAGSTITTYGDTWTWQRAWHQMFPATSPSARQGAGMAYDGAAGNIVLFGGSTTVPISTGTSLNDTWTWDGTNWTQQFPALSPPARAWTSMVYDLATRKVVLFGGNNLPGGDGPFDDTWTWDGIAKTWTEQNPASHPSARGSAPVAYDAVTRTVVLFGGVTTNSNNLNDTWTWNGTDWTQKAPTAAPSPRNGPTMAYHPGLRAVVLFGGAFGACCSTNLNDTWTWNGANWTKIQPAHIIPPSRNTAGMDYDVLDKVLILFGGGDSNSVRSDTWVLTLTP